MHGFDAKRTANAVAAVNLACVPVHFVVPCSVSGRLSGLSLALLLIIGCFCLAAPRATLHRYRPFAWGMLAVLLHWCSAH
jgi:hypothetical protein